jgi:hypothetical protein
MDRAERAGFFEKWGARTGDRRHAKEFSSSSASLAGHMQIEDDKQTRNRGFGPAERAELRDKLLAGFREKD